MSDREEISKTFGFLGAADKCEVTVKLTSKTFSWGVRLTDGVSSLTNGSKRWLFSIMGLTYDKTPGGRWRERSGGQCQEEIKRLLDQHLISGGTIGNGSPTLRRLLELWERWHNNELHAGCLHQQVRIGAGEKLECYPENVADVCPTRGYRFGSEWLLEEIPGDVVTEMLGIVSPDCPGESSYGRGLSSTTVHGACCAASRAKVAR